MSEGPVPIGWQPAVSRGSPPPPVELIVSSSSSRVTPRPPTVMQTDDNDASGGGDGGAEKFKGFTDEGLEEKIRRMRSSKFSIVDGGEKLRKFVCQMEKELDRRRAAGPMKVNTGRRQAVKPSSRDDPYAFNNDDELNGGSVAGKYHYSAPPIKRSGQVAGLELGHFLPGKQDWKRARNAVNSEPKNRTVGRKIADNGRLNMDGRKLCLNTCTNNQQKNDSNDAKSMSRKWEDATFGSLTKRLDCSQNYTSEFERLSNCIEKKEQEIVFLDDEETESAKSVEVEMDNKRDEIPIYHPSRTDLEIDDLEIDDLRYSEIKCLEPEEYINSPVINYYIQYLKNSIPRDDLFIFTTFFYRKFEEARFSTDSQFSRFRRWWRTVDIFKKSYIILPIHGQSHWSLVIICMPAKETESGPIILHLDSLGLHSSEEVFQVIESCLKKEWSYLKKDSSYDIPFSARIWRSLSKNIDKQIVEVPRQQNEYDCGLFTLYYIQKFIQEAPNRLTRQNLRMRMFGREWFDPKEASGLRERIRALVLDAFQSIPSDDGNRGSGAHSDDHSECHTSASHSIVVLDSSDEE
ncbi:ubiquitin-like-specific protease 1D [Brachypodium distachyon]|uniref:Ubiquitin-like protease family profile domain-containing protein n=1 Tax=Brachypodium distachyon TaxID=15368 RepID=A0A2K2DEV0_BRADI|nr:ubiquitin-like-specific protease 1D [Brachypodium distachyon]PNT72803.1 hypothetical protein BRADI_2g49226v3 [Brachypodium distachyon]|eukprot:XP_010233511.3 ubiquitin-like-specific protease 1D [Brachypodium distachyon]